MFDGLPLVGWCLDRAVSSRVMCGGDPLLYSAITRWEGDLKAARLVGGTRDS